MGLNTLQIAQLSSAMANFSRTFTSHNPGQDRMAAGLEDSAKGIIQAEAAKEPERKAKKKAKKHAPWAAAIDTVALVAAPFTGGMSLQFAKPVKNAFGVADGNKHGIAKATGAAVDMGTMGTSMMGGGMGGGMGGMGSIGGMIGKGTQGGVPEQPKYPGLNPGEDPFRPWNHMPGGSGGSGGMPIYGGSNALANGAVQNKASLGTMSSQERLKYAIGRREMGMPLTTEEFALYPRKEWSALQENQIKRPSIWQMYGHYLTQSGQPQMSSTPQTMQNTGRGPYGIYEEAPW